MDKSNAWETALLGLLFNADAIANIADDAASGPLTNLYVSLHTADPGEAGNQQSNEAAYGDYARVAVARDNTGWTVSANTVTNVDPIVFPEAASGTESITHVGIGTAASGASTLLYKGELTAPLNVSTGIEPRFEAGDLDLSED